MDKQQWKKIHTALSLSALCMCVISAILFLYYYDNKYNAQGPKGDGGILRADGHTLDNQPVIFLVDGWAYYGGRLLTPNSLIENQPDEYIFIGQYGGFDAGDMSRAPHGSASYRLTVQLTDETKAYALELPEIFSAYQAYVNGKLVQQMGDTDPEQYRPQTGNRLIMFEAGGEADILIAVSDYSHIYSGMVYPPAFGQPDAVYKLLNARLVFRGLLAAFALAVGMLSLLYGIISRKNGQTVLYGLLCLFFVGYTSYPILHSLIDEFYPFYFIEMFSFCAIPVLVMLLQKTIHAEKWSRVFVGYGGLMCAMSMALTFLLPMGNLSVMSAYSYSVMAYEWIAAAYLTWSIIRAVRLGKHHSHILLYGILIFDVTLIMDRLLLDYEPIVTAWFPELASFMLVLFIGLAVAKEVAQRYRDSVILAERMSGMERLMDMQRKNYDLLHEQVEQTQTLRHDLRHHFVVLDSFVQNRSYNELERYLRSALTEEEYARPLVYSDNTVINALVWHYALLSKKNGITMILKLEVGTEIKVAEADLCVVLGNLLENGLQACERKKQGERFIILSIGQKPSALSIRMENSTDGRVTAQGGVFLSSKSKGRKGYGLESIRATAKRYNGDTSFHYDNDKEVFLSTVLLMLR